MRIGRLFVIITSFCSHPIFPGHSEAVVVERVGFRVKLVTFLHKCTAFVHKLHNISFFNIFCVFCAKIIKRQSSNLPSIKIFILMN